MVKVARTLRGGPYDGQSVLVDRHHVFLDVVEEAPFEPLRGPPFEVKPPRADRYAIDECGDYRYVGSVGRGPEDWPPGDPTRY